MGVCIKGMRLHVVDLVLYASVLFSSSSSVATLQAWNKLPAELKLLQLTSTFLHQLKTFLVSVCLPTQ